MAKLSFPIRKIVSRINNPGKVDYLYEDALFECSITESEAEEIRIGEESYEIRRVDLEMFFRALGLQS